VKVVVWTDRKFGLPIPFGYSFGRGEDCPHRTDARISSRGRALLREGDDE
jgi:hypothetical protein